MEFFSLASDSTAFTIFIISLAVSVYSRRQAAKSTKTIGKKIRESYRKSWMEFSISHGKLEHVVEVARNNIMISVALMSSIVISFGFFLNGSLASGGSIFSSFGIMLIISLLVYSFFSILLEIRTLTYIPILAGVNQKLIFTHEGKSKIDYISSLLDSAFDQFSNSTRILFYVVVLLIWFYNVYAFVIATVLLTWFMIREDFGETSRIGIF